MMTQASTGKAAITNLIGLPIGRTTRCGLRVTVTLWHTHAAIETRGQGIVEHWSGNVELADAHREVTRIFRALDTWGGPDGVDQRIEELARYLHAQDNRPAGMRDRDGIEAAEKELTQLESLHVRRLRDQLRTDLAA